MLTQPKNNKKYKHSFHWWKTIGWQYIALQHTASRLMGAFTKIKCPSIKNWQIRTFIRLYGVNMQEALIQDYREYHNFNDFFTRQLKANARPIANHPTSIISPADGILSQFGTIDHSTLMQAKGKFFTTQALLGYPSNKKTPFNAGYFATIYLAPKNYHRVHMPITGTLKAMRFIPGALFSVSTHTADHIDNLFAKNERVVCFFDTELGPLAVIMVGAMLVSSMATKWAGVVQSKTGKIEHIDYNNSSNPIILQKGEELGHFNMGSTVILLMGEKMSHLNWNTTLNEGSGIKMGQLLANTTNNSDLVSLPA